MSEFEWLEGVGWEVEIVIDKSHFTALANLEGSFTVIGDAGDSDLIELSPKNVGYVEGHLRQAKAHHAEGSLEDAWFHLLQASNSLAYHRGVREGRFQASKVDRPAQAGKKGGRAKAAKVSETLDGIAKELLELHASTPLRTMADFDIAALQIGQSHGMDSEQTAWLAKLKKKSVMLALVAKLRSVR